MKKYTQETVVGIFVVVGLFAIAYMTVKLGNVGFLGENSYSLYAKFSTVTGLRTGNPVNMLGLEIGRVESFKMDQDNQVAVVELKINNGIKIYDDAIASIKTEGLIGDKFISIDAGGSGDLLKNGDLITDTESPTDIMDLVSKYAFGDVGGEKK
jgi:phospholipid/cholesterol/gamma-HCH transport system substrate-binding protein